jgi:hypothetical protein
MEDCLKVAYVIFMSRRIWDGLKNLRSFLRNTQFNVHNVAYRPVARQRPQHTRGQQYRSSVFYVRGRTVAMQRVYQIRHNIN